MPGALPYITADAVSNPYQVSNYNTSTYGYQQSSDLANLLNGYGQSGMGGQTHGLHTNVKLEPNYGGMGMTNGSGMTNGITGGFEIADLWGRNSKYRMKKLFYGYLGNFWHSRVNSGQFRS